MGKVILEVDVRGEEDVRAMTDAVENLNKEVDKTGESANKTSGQLEEVGKNGGAIATLDRLTGGLASQIRDAFEASKLFNGSLKATRAALIGTGIGAFVVGLGVVVAYWDDIVELITRANARLERQQEILESTGGLLDSQIDLLEQQIKVAGENTVEAQRLKEQLEAIREERILTLEAEIKSVEAQNLLNAGKREEVGLWDSIVLSTFQALGQFDLYAQKQAEILANKIEENNADQERLNNLRKQLALLQLAKIEADSVGVGTGANGEAVDRPQGLTAASVLDNPRIVEEQLVNAVILDAREDFYKELNRINELAKEAEKKQEQDLLNAKLLATADAFNAISGLLGQASAESKALGIATAVIDTYVGANKALAQGGFIGIATAAAVIATGLANVQKIASTQLPGVPGSFSSAGASVSAPTVPVPQASFNVIGDSGVNTLADSITSQQNQPIRAYITQQDITSSAQMERETRSSSTV